VGGVGEEVYRSPIYKNNLATRFWPRFRAIGVLRRLSGREI
jgi:hypothetical protein